MTQLQVIEGGASQQATPLLVTVVRWPVIGRVQGPDGRMKRAESSYLRTSAPTVSRTERVTHLTATRAFVTWGHESGLPMHTEEFLLAAGGRMAGNADWMLSKSSLKELRRLAKEMYPDEPDEEDDDALGEPDERSPMELAEEATVSDSQAPEGA